MLNARMMHDCDCSGDGEQKSGLGEQFGVNDAGEPWNLFSFIGSGDAEDTLLYNEEICSILVIFESYK